jgi:hypothetical protein
MNCAPLGRLDDIRTAFPNLAELCGDEVTQSALNRNIRELLSLGLDLNPAERVGVISPPWIVLDCLDDFAGRIEHVNSC